MLSNWTEVRWTYVQFIKRQCLLVPSVTILLRVT